MFQYGKLKMLTCYCLWEDPTETVLFFKLVSKRMFADSKLRPRDSPVSNFTPDALSHLLLTYMKWEELQQQSEH